MAATPMMTQYQEIKQRYPDCLLFFRLGDFYELFGEDAKVAARILEITLTGRDAGAQGRIPMCGVPYHAVDSYLGRLIKAGYRVAICEQLEDPKSAKGVVKRDVVRVVTPGTYLEGGDEDGKNTFLLGLFSDDDSFGLAVCDLATGEFRATTTDSWKETCDELARLNPAEVLVPHGCSKVDDIKAQTSLLGSILTPTDSREWDYELTIGRLSEQFGQYVRDSSRFPRSAIRASGAVLLYIIETQKTSLRHLRQLTSYRTDQYLQIDWASRRSLEITETVREGKKQGSLFGVLDRTVTSMGRRMLRFWLEHPLLSVEEIGERQEAVAELLPAVRRLELVSYLDQVYDMERLIAKLGSERGNARDLLALKNSLVQIPSIIAILETCSSKLIRRLATELNPLNELTEVLARALVDDPPVSVTDGGLIREGYNRELDEIRATSGDARAWIKRFEQDERQRTGIKSLKVGFNKVFGYFIEVTKPNVPNVPDHYERKQTLANAERFVTAQLKEKEALILGAHERTAELEYQLFLELRSLASSSIVQIQQNARALACLDVLQSLARVASERQYVCPQVVDKPVLDIRDGRHPVIETVEASFVPNDLFCSKKEQIILLTGPNMAGKSTYLRQAALLVLMSQIGSFIPAKQATVGLVDKIFTRIGAADDLSSGQSTFMVECAETANLLLHATPRSLVILDELGRGTSTYDGMAIAQAVVEYIHDHIGARTLFSTHYHELTKLGQTLQRLSTYRMEVSEKGGQIYFLHKVAPGTADRSYGINVARMAGIPQAIIERSVDLLYQFEAGSKKPVQLDLFSTLDYVTAENGTPAVSPWERELQDLDVNQLTPLQALQMIAKWQNELRGEVKK